METKSFSNQRGDIKAELNGEELSVTFKGETRTFKKTFSTESHLIADKVFGGKFKTGTKVWPLSIVCVFASGNLLIQNGGYSNKNGVTSIVGWFNPEASNVTRAKGAA